ELDAIAMGEPLMTQPPLTEYADLGRIPGNCELRSLGVAACRCQRIGDGGAGRQLETPQMLPGARCPGNGTPLVRGGSRYPAHGRLRARATNASTSELMVWANSGSKSTPVRRLLEGKLIVSANPQPWSSTRRRPHPPPSQPDGTPPQALPMLRVRA